MRSTLTRRGLSKVMGQAVASLALLSTIAHATESVVFTIDPAVSTFSLSGVNNVYGNYVPQSPGSDTSSVSGHFLVKFDPLTNSPTSLQFIGNDGYYQSDSPLALKTAAPGVKFDYTGLTWDFSSPVLAGAGGSFTATTTNFLVSDGNLNAAFSDGQTATYDEQGYKDHVTAGTWTLHESTPGSGSWTLGIVGHYTTSLDWRNPYGSGNHTFTLNATATAQFGAANVASLTPEATGGDVLGGAGTTGGVSISFDGATNGGAFTAQQIPNNTGLPQAAIAAAEANPIFALSTESLSANPQIWSVEYTGLQLGQAATLVFNYDPALLPAGTDESQLGIWHFNKIANAWEFGGTVDTALHTITFVTTSFSPFELGLRAVPEPSTLLLCACGLVGLLVARRRKR